MRGRALIFLNVKQAARFGHVGWGFALDDSRYFFGSTDHLYRHKWWDLPAWLRYSNVAPGGDIDWWGQTGTREQMLAEMSPPVGPRDRYHIWYHLAKELDVPSANPEAAVQLATSLNDKGWCVLNNNCLKQAHAVLTAYGADIPPLGASLQQWLPKVWFAAIRGEVIQLAR